MPSGKRSKQQRRDDGASTKAPPAVRSKGVGARPRQASPRVLAIGGGVLALVIVGVVLAVALGGGGGGGKGGGIPQGTPTIGNLGANALPGASEIDALYKGIPQKGLYLGSDTAPVQMVMFVDLQCPICQEFEVTALPTIVKDYIRPGKVRLYIRPWAFIGPDSFTARKAMLAAALQNKAFQFAGVLYDNQGTENSGWVSDSILASIAASVKGLNVSHVFAQRSSSAVSTLAKDVDSQAIADNVQGTPTVLVGKNGTTPKDVTTPGNAPTLAEVTNAIDKALAG